MNKYLIRNDLWCPNCGKQMISEQENIDYFSDNDVEFECFNCHDKFPKNKNWRNYNHKDLIEYSRKIKIKKLLEKK